MDAANKQRIIDIQEEKEKKDQKNLELVQDNANKGVEDAKTSAINLIENANNEANVIKNAKEPEPATKLIAISNNNMKQQSTKPSVEQPYTPNSLSLIRSREASFSYRPNSFDLLKPQTSNVKSKSG